MRLMEFIKMTLPAYVISAIIFYLIFRKVIGERLRNIKTYKKLMLLIGNIIFYSICLMITDSFEATRGYHAIFSGIFIGIIVSCIPLIMPNKNN